MYIDEKEKAVEILLQHHHSDLIRGILMALPDWQVYRLRQKLNPKWQDGFHESLFDKWYCSDDTKSPARQWFVYLRNQQKHYPAQGWAPEDDGIVGIYKCSVCDKEIDDDDIFLNHFRNGHCDKFDELVENCISEDEFWKNFNDYKYM